LGGAVVNVEFPRDTIPRRRGRVRSIPVAVTVG
jgi:hypothetical protein